MVGPGERNGMERVKPMSSYQPRVMDKPAWKKCFYLDYGDVSTL